MISILTQRANPVTLKNLRRGIKELFAYLEKQKNSPKDWDFHNFFYLQLETNKRRGLTLEFWENFLVNELWNWRAIRPKTKQEILEEGKKKFPELQYCYDQLSGSADSGLPSIEFMEWEDVSPLFELSNSIKDMKPPTFGSKLCHFLFPSAYFIFDNKLVKRGWEKYSDYWKDCRDEWLKQPDKELLKKELRRFIPSTPCASYPWPTKITELCQFDVKK